MAIRIVDAGRALAWFQEGFALFRQEPLVWIVQVVVFIAILIVLGLVPFAGHFVATLLSPVFAAGFLWTCDQGRHGQPMKIEHLFEGFRRNTTPLLIAGAIYAVGALIAGAVAAMLVLGTGLSLGAMAGGMGDGSGMAMGAAMLMSMLVVLVALLLMLPLALAIWFAPALILFDGMSAMDAMKQSFIGCCKNWLALLLYGVVFLVLSVLATIPAGLGWLVLAPTIMASTYLAYLDIFRAQGNAQ